MKCGSVLNGVFFVAQSSELAVMQASSHTKKGAALASRALRELPCGGRRYGRAIITIAVAPSVKVAR